MSLDFRLAALFILALFAGCTAVPPLDENTDTAIVSFDEPAPAKREPPKLFPEIEQRLRPLATAMPKPGPSDWLAQHKEAGQTFDEYVASQPVRKSERRDRIYLCLIGEFSKEQELVLTITSEYLAVVFQVPVEVREKLSLDKIPERAKRKHPTWGDQQVLSTYVLEEVLQPNRPKNALAYIAFTSSDLWPGEGWNFVFGQASLSNRVGVWSIYRDGNPAKSADDFHLCLSRTMKTASHETGHILGLPHCIAFHCNMNGSNNRSESDLAPLQFCPVCLRKVCWNLQVAPAKYLQDLETFCTKHHFDAEAKWYRKARESHERATCLNTDSEPM